MNIKRTIAYCDGYNLYHRLLRNTSFKWLDLAALVAMLLREDHRIAKVKYFTSRICPHPYDPLSVDRQRIYLQALSQNPAVQIIEGKYNKRKTWLPFASEPCRSCPRMAPEHMGQVYKFEEKRTDVNLATEMLVDAALNHADCLVLVSGDSDFISAIDSVRNVFDKTVLVFDPSEAKSIQLSRAANYYKNIPRDLPAQCQLPEVIPVGKNGRTIHRPDSWA